jgi:hypothetical protein
MELLAHQVIGDRQSASIKVIDDTRHRQKDYGDDLYAFQTCRFHEHFLSPGQYGFLCNLRYQIQLLQ